MKPRTAILALLCLMATWDYALTLASIPAFWFKPGIINNFYPLWNASRSILHHIDPYSPEVTEQNEIAAYGVTAKVLGTPVRQRFAYPVYATFPVLPLALLDSGTAKQVALCLFAALVRFQSVGYGQSGTGEPRSIAFSPSPAIRLSLPCKNAIPPCYFSA